jgi:hypothetical protein
VVVFATFSVPVVAVQLTEKLAVTLEPTRVTTCGFELVTLQFCATPLSWTVWAPGNTPLNWVLPLAGTDWLWSKSMVAV